MNYGWCWCHGKLMLHVFSINLWLTSVCVRECALNKCVNPCLWGIVGHTHHVQRRPSADVIDLGCVYRRFGTDNRGRSNALRTFYRDGGDTRRRYELFGSRPVKCQPGVKHHAPPFRGGFELLRSRTHPNALRSLFCVVWRLFPFGEVNS